MKLFYSLGIFLALFIMCFYILEQNTKYIWIGVIILAILWLISSIDLDKLYLRLNDCDGMCNHCKDELKQIYKQYKNQ